MGSLGILADALVLGVTVKLLDESTEPLFKNKYKEFKEKEIKLDETRISLFD
jgi:hypothetical protein